MLIDKMNALKNLTTQEKEVVRYINQNLKSILDMNISQLAKASYTSSSTIIRLSKKLGFKGYTELKYVYVQEYPEIIKQKEIKEKPFQENTSIDEVMEILPQAYFKTINYAKTMVSRNRIIRITNLMKQAQRIEFYAVGMNYDLAKMIAYRFESINKDCMVYTSPHLEHLKYIQLNKIPTIAILISRTGSNSIIIEAAKLLKKHYIPTISISTNREEDLLNITDENIEIIKFQNELELKSTMFSIGVQYILDVCISSLMIYDINNIEKVIEEMRKEK